MINCPTCKKRHKTELILNRCKERHERKTVRDAKSKEDEERRAAVEKEETALDFIRRTYCREGQQATSVAAHLNRYYPKRTPKWSWMDVLAVHIEHLNWPM